MKTLNSILYPYTSIWDSDVWDKDVIFESNIPEPKIVKTKHTDGSNISQHEHIYPFEHEGHKGKVSIIHYLPTDPKKPVKFEEGENEPGAVDISFSFGKDKYRSINKGKYPPATRAAVGAKIRGIIQNHILTRGKQFADEMKQNGIPTFLRAEAYEPGVANAFGKPSLYKAAKAKHIAYQKMFTSLGKKNSDVFHPFRKPEDTGYEDIVGAFRKLYLHYK